VEGVVSVGAECRPKAWKLVVRVPYRSSIWLGRITPLNVIRCSALRFCFARDRLVMMSWNEVYSMLVELASCVRCTFLLTSRGFVRDLHRVHEDADTGCNEQTRSRIGVPHCREGPIGICGLHRWDKPYRVTPAGLLRSCQSVSASRVLLS
jgi:hypothetical protein